MQSKSRGWVRLASADPAAPPRIQFNYMSREDDWADMRACVRLTREIFAQPAFKRFYSREISPGASITSDADIDAFVKEKMQSGYHPCGTCRMGATSDPLTVVDSQTRVVGVEALRVIDASIMPSITNGKLERTHDYDRGEEAADFVRGRQPLAPVDVPWYESDVWRVEPALRPAASRDLRIVDAGAMRANGAQVLGHYGGLAASGHSRFELLIRTFLSA